MAGSSESDHVANCRNTWHACAIRRIDSYIPAIHLKSETFRVKSSRHRSAAGRDEKIRNVQRLRASVCGLNLHVDVIHGRFRARYLRPGEAGDAAFPE